MKTYVNVLLVLLFCGFSVNLYAQPTLTVPYTEYYECDQEYGLHREKGDFLMTIAYDEHTLIWRTDDVFSLDSCRIVGQTEDYIFALSSDSTHVFYNKRDQQLFYLMRWETTYTAYGLGKGYFAIRETVKHIMHRIKRGADEREIMSFLAQQASYGF